VHIYQFVLDPSQSQLLRLLLPFCNLQKSGCRELLQLEVEKQPPLTICPSLVRHGLLFHSFVVFLHRSLSSYTSGTHFADSMLNSKRSSRYPEPLDQNSSAFQPKRFELGNCRQSSSGEAVIGSQHPYFSHAPKSKDWVLIPHFVKLPDLPPIARSAMPLGFKTSQAGG
jgi:hypothetical protein